MRALLVVVLLAGCAAPAAPPYVVMGVVLTALYDEPTTPDAFIAAARASGWSAVDVSPGDDIWRVDLEQARVQLVAWNHTDDAAWAIQRSVSLPEADRVTLPTFEEADAHAETFRARFEPAFAEMLAPLERAGGWERRAVQLGCNCATE